METHFEILLGYLSYINERTARELASSSDGLLVCEEAIKDCEDLKKYIGLLGKINDLKQLPQRVLFEIKNRLHLIFLKIETFNETVKDPRNSDENQIRNFKEYFMIQGRSDSFYEHFSSLTTAISKAMLFADNEPKEKQLNDLIESATTAEKQIKNLLEGVAEESSKSGIAKHARIFNAQSSVNKKRANAWKIWAVGLSVALISFATIMFYEHKDTYSIQVAIYSALVIAVLFYAISISVKSFFGEMHNHVVNRHKANCLNTFKTLIETADKDNAHVILKLATETIFSHQTSGFLKRESSSSSPSPILEIIKNASQTNTT